MINRYAISSATVALALLATACTRAGTDRYPSLAPRDVERISGTAQPTDAAQPPAPPVIPSPELAQRLHQLRQQAQTAHGDFLAALPQARSAVMAAQGASVAGENWSVAQAALARLDARRNPAAIALAELDRLYVDSELAVGAADAIAAERATVQALITAQDAAVDELSARVPN